MRNRSNAQFFIILILSNGSKGSQNGTLHCSETPSLSVHQSSGYKHHLQLLVSLHLLIISRQEMILSRRTFVTVGQIYMDRSRDIRFSIATEVQNNCKAAVEILRIKEFPIPSMIDREYGKL